MATAKSKATAKKRLAKLDAEYTAKKTKIKKAQLRTQVAMGGRKTRKKAASQLSSMARETKKPKPS